ncbi:MAG: MIP/aquaporin family protein [Candidatus Acidiferrales bacterium]
MLRQLAQHWPEYVMEAAELALFMISAGSFAMLFYHPDSPVSPALGDTMLTRFLMGLAMAATAMAIIYSPMGQRSGAHFNPAITLAYLRLGKVERGDAFFYVLAQFAGGVAGMALVTAVARNVVSHPAVNYAATLPGPAGPWLAFAAELAISFGLILVVLHVSNDARIARYTPLFVGALVAVYVTFESPISGMSMNPARTLGSAAPSRLWDFLWIYFTAPLLGMLLGAELYLRQRGAHAVRCAKLNHHNRARCIFRCNYRMARSAQGRGG